MKQSFVTLISTLLLLVLALLPASANAEALSPQFFGISVLHAINKTPWPQKPYNGIRLWDADGTGWPQVNPGRGKYDWSSLDKWLTLARKRNVDVLYTFGRVPAWANGNKGQSVPPSDLADWDSYVRAIVKHTKGQVKFWEIWNEPNDPRFWTGDNATLIDMARRAYQIIKAEQPTAVVLTPSATWTTTSPSQWFDRYFAAGGGQYADVIAFHGYVGTTPEGIVPELQKLWAVTSRHWINKPIWDTEASWGLDAKLSDPVAQANFLARFYILQVSQGVQRFYWYAWDGSDGGKTSASESWGTLWNGKSTRPAADAYATVRQWLLQAQLPLLCHVNESVWQCPLNGTSFLVWNPAKHQDFQPDVKFTRYFEMTGKPHLIEAGQKVPIGPAPILVQKN